MPLARCQGLKSFFKEIFLSPGHDRSGYYDQISEFFYFDLSLVISGSTFTLSHFIDAEKKADKNPAATTGFKEV